MLNIKDIVENMRKILLELDICRFEKRFTDMPYYLGKLQSYNELLHETITERLRELKSEKDENES